MDLVALHQRGADATGAIIEKLSDEDLHARTPCSDWTVREVIVHLVQGTYATMDLLLGSDAGAVPLEDDIVAQFAKVTAEFTAVIGDSAALARPVTLAGVETDGRAAVAVRFADTLVHGWDIGRATGREVTIAEDLASAALRIAGSFPERVRAGDHPAFGPPVAVTDDASPTDRLVAFTGRDPSWTPAA